MGDGPTVQFPDVLVRRETALALVCCIAGKSHPLALSRIQPGSTVRHAGDRGVLVLTRDFAVELGLAPAKEQAPRARCDSLTKDGLPCGGVPRNGSRLCWAHAGRTAGEPSPPRPANALRCESLRKDGLPCRAPQRPGGVVCYSHDPTTAEQRRAAQALAAAATRRGSVRRHVG